MARRLAAIVATDVVGFSRLMGADDASTVEAVKSHRKQVFEPILFRCGGRVVNYVGDAALFEFESVVNAVAFAVEAQLSMGDSNACLPPDKQVAYRFGINIGDVIADHEGIYGDGVNIAARLESLADPGGICVSQTVRTNLAGKLDLDFKDLGEQSLKNISQSVYAHHVVLNDKARAIWVPDVSTGTALDARPKHRWRGLAAMTLVMGLLAAGLGWLQPWYPVQTMSPSANLSDATISNRVAVLPFRNISDDPEQEFFALGLAEDLIADLTTVEGIAVIARTSSFQASRDANTTEIIADQLNARYIIGGSVRRARDTLRISVNLVDASSGTTIWAERFDGTNEDVFEFQDRIMAQIVDALDIVLVPSTVDTLQASGTKSPVAYDAYLKGLNAISELKLVDLEGNKRALSAFQQAIELDPDFAKAYSGLAWANWLHFATVNYYSFDRRDRAFALAERSISIADNALARRTLAKRHYRIFGTGGIAGGNNLEMALVELRNAERLEPGNADVLADLASLLALSDTPEEGLKLVDRAIALNPDHPSWYQFSRGLNLLFLGRHAEASKAIRMSTANNPSWNSPKVFLAAAYALEGKEKLAQIALHDYHERGHLSPSKTYRDAIFRRWPMAPEATRTMDEAMEILGVTASAN